ncbi:dihydroxyacetone kinase subunit DhaL [Pseudonocardia xinjiangensis]|uniref:Dihydroxyacetone kinase subunit L n=1 Tax=Pseudonocardia xinjiangensis TaxID=75289 RepID=A0ABX1RC18_9PSEU|nr:dihydroxyacetone kinase subunit DhaL [Pseudonocardia xinjiangensis]NMH77922.1 dihydroxyacetone kinase subunit L [Pseudonocardia xinjiangensis]
MTSPSSANLEFVVRTIAQTAVDNERAFGELDAVVGDGDFGYSLARGFEIVLADWDSFDRTEASGLLQKIALTISKRVGGTSGPLWGTAFLRASAAVKGKTELTGEDAVAMLRGAAEGIKKRGNSDVGDKTLLDALVPMTDAIAERLAADPATPAPEVAKVAAGAARAAADATTSMQARRGRASYTGERSVGSPDAGAVAVAVMAERVAQTWPGSASS